MRAQWLCGSDTQRNQGKLLGRGEARTRPGRVPRFYVSHNMPSPALGAGDRNINRTRSSPQDAGSLVCCRLCRSLIPYRSLLLLLLCHLPPSLRSLQHLGSPRSCHSEHPTERARPSWVSRKWGALSPELREARGMWAPPTLGLGGPGGERQSHRVSHSTQTPEKWG